MATFNYGTTHRIHGKHIALHAYFIAQACRQSTDYVLLPLYVVFTHTNILCLCYSILKQYAQTKWHLYHPVGKSPRNSSGQKSFLLNGMATVYVGTWAPWPVKMGSIGCPETSINYQHTLLIISDKRGPQIHHEGSLNSRKTSGPSQYNELPIMK